jgi:hypothetical protein
MAQAINCRLTKHWIGCALIGAAVICVTVAGCAANTLVPDEERELRAISILYGRFGAANQGRSPASEGEFRKYAESLSPNELKMYGVDDLSATLTSSRDGQPYVIRFGVKAGPPTGPPAPIPAPDATSDPSAGPKLSEPVIAHEQTGKDGSRYVVFSSGVVELVDEARFREITAN